MKKLFLLLLLGLNFCSMPEPRPAKVMTIVKTNTIWVTRTLSHGTVTQRSTSIDTILHAPPGGGGDPGHGMPQVTVDTVIYGPKPVWACVLMGQSNASGVGVITSLPAIYRDPIPRALVYSYPGFRPLQAGVNNLGMCLAQVVQADHVHHGIELSMMADLANIKNDTVRLIKWTLGSTSLAVSWNPDASTINYHNLFYNACLTINAARGEAFEQGLNLQIGETLWYQGETDSGHLDWSTMYGKNLYHFIVRYRERTHTEGVHFTIIKIHKVSGAGGLRVRAAEDSVASVLPMVSTIETADIENPLGLHLTSPGYVFLGHRVAQVIGNK